MVGRWSYGHYRDDVRVSNGGVGAYMVVVAGLRVDSVTVGANGRQCLAHILFFSGVRSAIEVVVRVLYTVFYILKIFLQKVVFCIGWIQTTKLKGEARLFFLFCTSYQHSYSSGYLR